jgi:O-antigen ligase
VQERLFVYKLGAQAMAQHPFFGLGPLDERFLLFAENNVPGVHNTFLVELGATGIVGFIPYIAIILIAFRCCMQMTRSALGEVKTVAVIVLFQLSILMISMQSNIGIGEKAPWLIMALAVSLIGIEDRTMQLARKHHRGDF